MLRLRDIMTTDVVTVPSELSLRDAMELFTTRHISGAPVVAGAEVIGVVSGTDLLSFAASLPGVPSECPEDDLETLGEPRPGDDAEGDVPPAAFFNEMWDDTGAGVGERFREADGPGWNVLEEHTVAEVMSPSVCALPPNTPVDRAAEVMRSADIHRVLVMDGPTLTGIVTTKDIADAVADHRLTTRT